MWNYSILLAKIVAFSRIYLGSQFWHVVCLKFRLMKPPSRYTSSHVPPPNSIFQSCCTAMGILRTWELLSTLHYIDINIFWLNWTIPRRYFSPFFNKFWFWEGARNARIYKMLNIIFLKTPPTSDCPSVFLQKCNFKPFRQGLTPNRKAKKIQDGIVRFGCNFGDFIAYLCKL